MKKRFKVISAVMGLIMILGACGGGGGNGNSSSEKNKQQEGVVIKTNNRSPGTLDPALAEGTHDSWPINHLYEGLMSYDKEGKLQPAVAKEMPKIENNGLKYTFKIKEGLKWSNGDEITAEDFEYSWKRALDPSVGAEYAYQLYYIKGGEAYNSVVKPGPYVEKKTKEKKIRPINPGETDGLDIKGKTDDEINEMVFQKRKAKALKDVAIKAVDKYTLEVELEAPAPYFLGLTAFYTYYPVSKKVVESNPNWAKTGGDSFVCNGPFTLKEWRPKEKLILVKNENFQSKDKVKISGIEIDMIEEASTAYQKYEAGEYQILVDPPTAVVGQKYTNKDKDLIIGKQVGTYYYNLNPAIKPLNNVKVRKALSMALNRKELTDKVTMGGQIPAEGVVPYGILDINGQEFRKVSGNFIKEDLAEAKRLFEEGLKEEGMKTSDVNLTFLYNTDEMHKKIAQAVQAAWEKNLGIKITLENVEFQIKLDREKAGNYQISRAGWVGDYEDPMTMLDLWFSTSSFNDVKYNNPAYDKLISDIKASGDQGLRFKKMKEAEAMIMEDMPVVPIFHYTQPYLVKENVKGIYKELLKYPTLTYAEIN